MEARLFRQRFAAVSIGNVLEFFDFASFGALSDILALQFFPSAGGATVSFLKSSAVFGAAFFMRPIGGLCIGLVGDKYGRRRALELSILLMLLPSFAIGLLPVYATWGVASTLLLVFFRLVQGLACGGEVAGAFVYVIENTKGKHNGAWGGMCKATGNLGSTLGIGFCALLRVCLTHEQMLSFGWRLPFLFGILLGGVGVYLRSMLVSLEAMEASAKEQEGAFALVSSSSSSGGNGNSTHKGDELEQSWELLLEMQSDSLHHLQLREQQQHQQQQQQQHQQQQQQQQQQLQSDALGNSNFSSSSSSGAQQASLFASAAIRPPPPPSLNTMSYTAMARSLFVELWLEVLVTMCIVAFWGVCYYASFVWLAYFLTDVKLIGVNATKLEHNEVWAVIFISNFLLVLGLPLAGLLGDLLGSPMFLGQAYRGYRAVMVSAIALMLCFCFVSFSLFASCSLGSIVIGQSLLLLCISAYGGCMPALVVDLFPKAYRQSGVGVAYNLAHALFSGTVSLIMTKLASTGHLTEGPTDSTSLLQFGRLVGDSRMRPAFYLFSVGCFSLFFLTFGINAVHKRRREKERRKREEVQEATSPFAQVHDTTNSLRDSSNNSTSINNNSSTHSLCNENVPLVVREHQHQQATGAAAAPASRQLKMMAMEKKEGKEEEEEEVVEENEEEGEALVVRVQE